VPRTAALVRSGNSITVGHLFTSVFESHTNDPDQRDIIAIARLKPGFQFVDPASRPFSVIAEVMTQTLCRPADMGTGKLYHKIEGIPSC